MVQSETGINPAGQSNTTDPAPDMRALEVPQHIVDRLNGAVDAAGAALDKVNETADSVGGLFDRISALENRVSNLLSSTRASAIEGGATNLLSHIMGAINALEGHAGITQTPTLPLKVD